MQYYKKTSHTIYDCTYHIVWVTKYRYKVLIGDIGRRTKDLVQEICKDNGVEIIRGKVAANHVHIYVSIPPYQSVSKLVQYLKGKSSRKIVYLQQNCVTLSNFFASMNLLYKFGFLLCKYHRLIKTYAMFYDKWLCTEILLKFFTMKKWLSAKVFSHT